MPTLIDTLLSDTPDDLAALRLHLQGSRRAHDNRLVEQAAADVLADPDRAIRFDEAGWATVRAAGQVWAGGRLTTPTLAELRRLAATRVGQAPASGRARLFLLSTARSSEPLADVGSFHALAGPGTLIQVASQFNGLEAPGPGITPVERYFRDPTQGPRSALAGLPGLLVRHYRAPGPAGDRFVQQDEGRQLDFLEEALPRALGAVCGGYLRTDDLPVAAREGSAETTPARLAALWAAAEALTANVAQVRVGLHEGVQVVLGHDFFGRVDGAPRVTQLLTSAFALEYSDRPPGRSLPRELADALCRPLLQAVYRGTLLGAVATGAERVLLTLIGGGVFGNPHRLIVEAIRDALAEVDPLVGERLQVLVNCHTQQETPSRLLDEARARGGSWIHIEGDGAVRRSS